MENLKKDQDWNSISMRIFIYDQLVKIRNENYERFDHCVDPKKLKQYDIFICTPLMFHDYAFGVQVKPHLRVRVESMLYNDISMMQDMTLEQYEQGEKFEILTKKNY